MTTATAIPVSSEMTPIGQFEVVSGRLRISDPCHEANEAFAPCVDAKPGVWVARRFSLETDGLQYLVAHHIGFRIDGCVWTDELSIGVDTGRYGVFDDEKHVGGLATSELFEDLSEATSYPQFAAMPHGAATGNRYGDGYFRAFTVRQGGIVVAVMVGR